MNGIDLSYNYNFNEFHLSNYSHTDASSGAIANYVALMLRGRAKIVSKDCTVEANEGDVFFIPQGLPYHSYWYGTPDITFLSIGYHELNISDKHSYKLQSVMCDDNVKDAIKAIETNGTNVDCRSLYHFYRAMSLLLPLLKTNENKEKIISEKIKALIRQNPRISIAELAAQCSVSEPYLYLIFKNSENFTPNEYRHSVLCNMAYTLLTTTDKSIEEISDDLMFSSSSYFRKTIKSFFGITPREIRKCGIL